MSPEFAFSLVYLLVCLCILIPPVEVRAAGLSVQYLLSSWLGSEEMEFIQHHIRRTTATAVIHSLLPIGYFIGLGVSAPSLHLFNFNDLSAPWLLYLLISSALCISVPALCCYWSRKNWTNHPIARTLCVQGNCSAWTNVAGRINTEFRRIDKFTTGPPDFRVIVTDSWVMRTWLYGVRIAHHADCHLNLLRTDEHALSIDSRAGAQFLDIEVISVNKKVKPFEIRLHSSDYKDLRDKLTVPVVNARNVVIQQTLTDRFYEAFRHQVQSNPLFPTPGGVPASDNCIGCLQAPANIKLVKLCEEEAARQDGACVQCFCRPMWCMECMCKWFASRQDQGDPGSWMGSRAPCPTCRSRFCMLDVCLIP